MAASARECRTYGSRRESYRFGTHLAVEVHRSSSAPIPSTRISSSPRTEGDENKKGEGEKKIRFDVQI